MDTPDPLDRLTILECAQLLHASLPASPAKRQRPRKAASVGEEDAR